MREGLIRQVLEHLNVYEPNNTVRMGQWLQAPCPFAPFLHARGIDRHPSFGIAIVDDGYSYFKCFSCHQKGLLFYLPDALARIEGDIGGNSEGVSFVLEKEIEALQNKELGPPRVMDYVSNQKPDPINRAIYSNVYQQLSEYAYAIDYLNSRGVSLDTANKLGILFDDQEQRIVFPIEDRENLLYGFTGRTIRDEWIELAKKNNRRYPRIKNYRGIKKDWFLLGEQRIQAKKPIFVVEGLFGYATLIDKGIEEIGSVVALMGSDLSDAQAKTLISMNCPIYLLFDNDDAGNIGIFGSDGKSGAAGKLYNYCPLLIPEWPEGKEDPDQLLLIDIDNMVNLTDNYVIRK